MNFGHFKRLVR